MSDDVVGRLAKGSLFSRLFGSGRQPLRLVAIPRDHVAGDRERGDALLGGRLSHGSEEIGLADIDFTSLGARSQLAREIQGFSWLRDLAAAASREKGARLAEAIAGRWLIAHGTRPDDAWSPELWGERILFWTAYAPYILSSRDSGYRSALLNTLARAARHIHATADKAPPGLPRITAWAGALVASLTVQGALSRLSRAESGLMRALSASQFEDGGLMSRSPQEQVLLVDRLGLVRAAYFAAKQTQPEALENAAPAALAALHGVTMGDHGLSSWQGGNPGDPARLAALVEGCGLRARPLRQAAAGVISAFRPWARSWSSTRLRRRRRKWRHGMRLDPGDRNSDGAQRLVVNCGGPGLVRQLCRRTGPGTAIDRGPFDTGTRRQPIRRDPA
jgi:uncharacterized heparinase superfamily protein